MAQVLLLSSFPLLGAMTPSSSKMKKPAAVAASPQKRPPKKEAKPSQDKQAEESALKGLPVRGTRQRRLGRSLCWPKMLSPKKPGKTERPEKTSQRMAKDAEGKYPRILEKEAKAMNQKLKQLKRNFKAPALTDGWEKCKSQQAGQEGTLL